jgi:sulfate adenylyltransferase subunit 1 (EFTu-like GTPase family)
MQPIQVEWLRESGGSKELLRFITCGSVDDGKSTLIGRLLHDSKLIYDDQMSSLVSDSAWRRGRRHRFRASSRRP